MKNPYIKVGIGILIFNKHEQILLGKRISSHGYGTWGPPGGHLEFGENFEECAIREMQEETGLEINEVEFLTVTNDIFSDNKHYVTIFMKTKMPNDQEIQNSEPHKTEIWQWFDMDKLPNLLFKSLENLMNKNSYGRINFEIEK